MTIYNFANQEQRHELIESIFDHGDLDPGWDAVALQFLHYASACKEACAAFCPKGYEVFDLESTEVLDTPEIMIRISSQKKGRKRLYGWIKFYFTMEGKFTDTEIEDHDEMD